jgi:hypothetical protein
MYPNVRHYFGKGTLIDFYQKSQYLFHSTTSTAAGAFISQILGGNMSMFHLLSPMGSPKQIAQKKNRTITNGMHPQEQEAVLDSSLIVISDYGLQSFLNS